MSWIGERFMINDASKYDTFDDQMKASSPKCVWSELI